MTATLTRYYHSGYRDQSHPALKQAALEYWDNPQLKSQQNKWHQYVSESVHNGPGLVGKTGPDTFL